MQPVKSRKGGVDVSKMALAYGDDQQNVAVFRIVGEQSQSRRKSFSMASAMLKLPQTEHFAFGR